MLPSSRKSTIAWMSLLSLENSETNLISLLEEILFFKTSSIKESLLSRFFHLFV